MVDLLHENRRIGRLVFPRCFFSHPMQKIKMETNQPPVITSINRNDFDNFIDFLEDDASFFNMESPKPPQICTGCLNIWITISAPTNRGTISNTVYYFARDEHLPVYIQELIN